MKPPVIPSPGVLYDKSYLDTLVRILTTYFTRWSAETEYNANRSVPMVATNDVLMGDNESSFLVNADGITMTLPDATSDRVGRSWTVTLGSAVSTTITLSQDNVFSFTASTSVTLTGAGASLTFRAMDNRVWSIV